MLGRLLKVGIAIAFAAGRAAHDTMARALGRAAPPSFTVLMYHSVKPSERARFDRQMDYLLRVAAPVRPDFRPGEDAGSHRHHVAVTFDDGYESILENALPSLRARRIPATVFVPTGYLGTRAAWLTEDGRRDLNERLLSASEVKRLRAEGVLIGSHSVHHRALALLSGEESFAELHESRTALEALLGEPIALCALPFGSHSPEVLRRSQEAGYRQVFLSEPLGTRENVEGVAVGRIGVSPSDWPLEYRLKVRGAYQWLPWAIAAKQRLRTLLPGGHASAARPLAVDHAVQVDGIEPAAWDEVLRRFADASVFQTWSYEARRPGRGEVSRLLVRHRGTVVAAAQARIVRIPGLGRGVAYVRWAPLWQPRGEPPRPEVLRQALRALRNEYAVRRRLLLRVFPVVFSDDPHGLVSVFESEGYRRRADLHAERTLLVDLRRDAAELRKGLHPKWRADLLKAEKAGLEVLEGEGPELWDLFTGIYADMVRRKQFVDTADIDHFRAVQMDLPAAFKLRIFVARTEGRAGAGIICSALGTTGLYLFGATNADGMATRGSYLLQWRAIEWLKRAGIETYDLNGINPEANPGTHRFKARLCGQNGREVRFAGCFEACESRLSGWIVGGAERARGLAARLRHRRSRAPERAGPEDA
jgi:peptidoglycan/xylan/chitin deacetylase (PgdA/CDA1 family)